MKTNPILECKNLSRYYDAKAALDDVNLTIGRGKIVGLLGPNGAGKTTLIKLANGLIRPSSGQIIIDGVAPGIHTKEIVSYLPDKDYFAKWMKASDVLNLFEEFYSNFSRKKADRMCETLGIKQDMPIKAMSKGTREKLQLILVMSRNAELYLLDEPIAGVDPAARDFILSTIVNNYNEDGTIIISTHLISDVERVLDEVVFIKDGRIVRHDTVDDIKEKEGKSIDEVFRDDFRMAVPGVKEAGYDR